MPDTTTYALTVPAAARETLTPFVPYPSHAAIQVDGVPVASGTASGSLVVGTAPRAVSVIVTTEAGQSRTYDVVIRRSPARSPTYLKASVAFANGNFGYAMTLSSSGSTLAVGGNSTSFSGDVHVFTRSDTQWSQQGHLKASNAGAGDLFGGALALSADGSTLAVGAAGEASNAIGVNGSQTDDSAAGAGAVYVFTRVGTQWTQQAYLKASNTEAGDLFGSALSLSADGSTLAVAAPSESSNAKGVGGSQDDNSAPGAGAVYVFTRAGTKWSQQAYVKASNTNAQDAFGSGLALSADGSTLAVGAPLEAEAAGAVYVFTRVDTQWSEQAYVKGSNTRGGSELGSALSLSADGSTLAVGAWGESSNAGAAYVFTRAGTEWSEKASIKASNAEAGDDFGVALSLSADGSTLAVGADGESSNATSVDGNQDDNSAPFAGAVYVFARTGTQWSQQSYVKASNTEADDNFGVALSLSANGSTVAVGSLGEASNATGVGGNQDDNSTPGAGAVYVY